MVNFFQKKWSIFLICLLLLTWPNNLFLQLMPSLGNISGLTVDYLIPKLYLNDMVIGAMFLSWLGTFTAKKSFQIKIRKELVIIIGFVTLLGVRQIFTAQPITSIWFYAKLLEMSWVGWWLWQQKSFFKNVLVRAALLTSLGFQSLIGLLQFITQHSIFPSYLFFGEVRLSSYAGLSKATLFGSEKILPYGTTPHPNILAGFLVTATLIYLLNLKNVTSFFEKAAAVIIFVAAGITLFLTQSVSGWLMAAVALAIWVLYQTSFLRQLRLNILHAVILAVVIIVPFVTTLSANHWPDSLSLTRRSTLNVTARNMIKNHPFFGVGLDLFTLKMEKYLPKNEAVRFVQPVHNVVYLWLAETGLFGVLGVFAIIYFSWQKMSRSQRLAITLAIVMLLPLLLWDHYLLTQQVGLLLIALILASFQIFSKQRHS